MLTNGTQPLQAYVAPFAAYLLLTAAASKFGAWYPWAYCVAVLVVAGVCFTVLRKQCIVRPHRKVLAAVAVGTVGTLLWIPLSALKLESLLVEYLPAWLAPTPRVAFNPFQQIEDPLGVGLFLTLRILGLVVLTPLAEELFWRGFLARWLISPDWRQIELGKFTPMSFSLVTLMFTLAHPEWLAAAVYCALLNGFLCYSKDLWSCIVAHGVSNLLLAAYVISTSAWWLW